MGTWKLKNRHKYLLQYHMIFVCKYRKKLLVSKQISDDRTQFSYEICQKHPVMIKYMETDKDPIPYMIEREPTMSISKIANRMKRDATYHIKERGSNHYYKKRRKIVLCHEKITNTRNDYLHKISYDMISENQVIVSENLPIRNMIGNHQMVKSILDVSWNELTRQLVGI